MLCKKCNKKTVCKHYDYIINAKTLDATINECSDYSTNLIAQGIAHFEPNTLKESTTIRSVNPNEFRDITVDYKRLSNEINKDKGVDDFKVTAVPTELVECKNPKCKSKTYAEDLGTCSECGADVCSMCSYTDMNVPLTDNHELITKVLCEDCFHKRSKENEKIMEPIQSETMEDVFNEMQKKIIEAPVIKKPAKKKSIKGDKNEA